MPSGGQQLFLDTGIINFEIGAQFTYLNIILFPLQAKFTENPWYFLIEILFLSTTLLCIFIVNFIADRITSKSEKLMHEIYNPRIFDQSREFRKIILVWMEMLKNPLTFEIIGIFRLNLEEFVVICDACYSLYNVFTKMQNKF